MADFWRIPAGKAKVKIKRFIHRCPRPLRVLFLPLLGGFTGLLGGGIPGFFAGLLLCYLLKELFAQTVVNIRILDYFENPGTQRFYEGEAGFAAWCALGTLVILADTPAGSVPDSHEKIVKLLMLEASGIFTGPYAEPYLFEQFSRLALSRKDRLSTDLLAESLAAKYSSAKTGTDVYRAGVERPGAGLAALASGEKGRALAGEIMRILQPSWVGETHSGGDKDPWKILGLTPGTPLKEIKFHYRRLAKQFHPDELQSLDEQRRETASRAFIAIKEAYKKISDEASPDPSA